MSSKLIMYLAEAGVTAGIFAIAGMLARMAWETRRER